MPKGLCSWTPACVSITRFVLDAPRGRTCTRGYAMVKLASFPLAAGIICLIVAAILGVRIGGPLDAQILNYYFVLSPKWLLITAVALVVPSLALVATH
jgi:hypothetical protein